MLGHDHSASTRPRIALVRGPLVSTVRAANNEATPCIGLAYVAGYLRQHGYDVEIVDAIGAGLNGYWNIEEHPGYICQGLKCPDIVDRIPADTDIIGFSAMFSGEWPIQRGLLMEIRRRFPRALIVGGGEHITALPEFSLRDCPALDVCVRGEGEHTFYELVESWAEKRDFSAVNGIGYLNEAGEFVLNGTLPRIRELSAIPWPYWPEGYLEQFWAAGKSYGVCTERDMPMLISRGCPFQCTFCSSPQMWTTLYKLRDVDDVIAEIKHYQAKYNISAVQLYDLTAITKRSWTVEFCRRLLDENIQLKWSLPSGTRSEALDRETLELLRKTGCNYLVYAPESGSPSTLKRIKKRIHLERVTESMLEAKRQGLILRANLIIGFPGETRQDIFQTLRYGLKLAVHGVDESSTNVFEPYPGSEIFDGLMSAGKIKLDDDYFMGLTSMYSDFTKTDLITFNDAMTPKELARWRLAFMLVAYGVGYLLYPSRILRTLRNVLLESHDAATVLEHRLKDGLRKMRALTKSRLKPTPVTGSTAVPPFQLLPTVHVGIPHALSWAIVHLLALLHLHHVWSWPHLIR
jgi:anaerobic magnesium-protoporphyrin IX monomethyl ester cyclase